VLASSGTSKKCQQLGIDVRTERSQAQVFVEADLQVGLDPATAVATRNQRTEE
jgi:hypothetical protein